MERNVVGTTVRIGLVVIAMLIVVALAWQLRLLLILAFLAALLAAGLHGPALWIERRGWSRTASVMATYAVLIGILALVIFLIFPPLVQQVVALADDLPNLLQRLRTGLAGFLSGIAGPGTGERIIDSVTQGAQQLTPQLGSLLSVPLTALSVLVNTFVIIVLSALMLLERDHTREWINQFVDVEDREQLDDVSRRALQKLGAYVRGQLFLMTVIGVGTGIGMVLVGLLTTGSPLPFLFPLALLAFVTEAIPMVGPFISGIPIALVGLLDGPLTGVLMAAWVTALQQLEGLILVPVIQSRAVALSPMVVLLAVIAGGSIAGIVGAIIAIPVVAVADVVLHDVVLPLRRERNVRRRRAESRAASRTAGPVEADGSPRGTRKSETKPARG